MNILKLSNRKNISIGIILSLITLVVSLIIHVFYTKFLVNSVGDTQYGVYSYALSITNWLTILSSAFFSSYIRFITLKCKEQGEQGEKQINSLFLLMFILFDIIAILLLIVVVILFSQNIIVYEQNDLLIKMILISGIQLLFSIPANIFSLFITYKQKHIWLRCLNLLSTTLPPLISIPFLISGSSIVAVLLIQSLILICTYIVNMFYAIFNLKEKFAIKEFFLDKLLLKEVLVFSGFMVLIEIVDKLNATSDQIILGSLDHGNYVNLVTVYQLSLSFSEFFASLSLAIMTIFTPMIHDSVINGKKEKIDKTFSYICVTQMLLLFLFFGGFVSVGREFISFWKPEHPEIYLFAIILLFIRLVPLTQNASYEIQKAANKFKFRSITCLIFAIINVGISIGFIFILGYENAIFACLIGTVFSTLVAKWFLMSRYNRKQIGLDLNDYWKKFLTCFAITALSCCASCLFNYVLKLCTVNTAIRFFVIGFVFVILFCFLSFVFLGRSILEIFYVVLKKYNFIIFESTNYLKPGFYHINSQINVAYKNKEYFEKIYLQKEKSSLIKKVISKFVIIYCNKHNDNEIEGDLIYRSKNKTHVFDFAIGKHYIFFDCSNEYIEYLSKTSQNYPLYKPKMFFSDDNRKIVCEEIITKNNVSFDLILNKTLDQLSQNKFSLSDDKSLTLSPEKLMSNIKNEQLKRRFIKKFREINFDSDIVKRSFVLHGDLAPGNIINSNSNDRMYVIDWENCFSGPFYYDIIHIFISYFIRYGDLKYIKNYFNGDYDKYFYEIFSTNLCSYSPSLKRNYYYFSLLFMLLVFKSKDGNATECIINDDELFKW